MNIFFAYTNDAEELLKIAKKEIKNINNGLKHVCDMQISLTEWKSHIASEQGIPETTVLEQANFIHSDICVFVFRFRYGTPTGVINPETNEEYKSGMEQEYWTAYREFKEKGKPEIIVLKSDEDVPREHLSDMSGYESLNGFFEDFKPKGAHPGLFNVFKSPKEFREQFTRNILIKVFRYLHALDSKEIKGIHEWEKSVNNGYKAIFIDKTNDSRNAAKTVSIQGSKDICLQAHSCYNFLCEEGYFHKFFREIMDIAKARIRIIMQNPWCSNAIRNSLTRSEIESQGEDYEEFHNGNIGPEKILELHEKSKWYGLRYKASINGYEQLKKDFGDRIELRMSDSDLSNSILITESDVFFEPYFRTINRGERNLSLFEIQADRASDLYNDAKIDFEDAWEDSITLDNYDEDEEKKDLKLHICNHGRI